MHTTAYARAFFSAPGTRVGDGASPPISFGASMRMSSTGSGDDARLSVIQAAACGNDCR